MAAQLLKERTSCRSGEERQNKDVRPGPRGDQNGWRKPAAAGEPRHAAAAAAARAAQATEACAGLRRRRRQVCQCLLAPSAGAGAAAGQQGTPQSGAQVHAPPVIIFHNQEANQQKASLNYKHRTIYSQRKQHPTDTQSLTLSSTRSYGWPVMPKKLSAHERCCDVNKLWHRWDQNQGS